MKKDNSNNISSANGLTLTRRKLLKLLLGSGAGVALGSFPSAAQSKKQLMRAIPKSGERIPAMGLGTSGNFEVGEGGDVRAPVKEVLRLFTEMGGRLIDTSPMYSTAETVVGDLAVELDVLKDLFIATKVWTYGRVEGIRQMETSMDRLRTKRIDLMQVHNLKEWQTHLTTLRAWKGEGRIRYLGVTHYRVDAYDRISRLIKSEKLDFVQFNYSIVTREAENRLLPLAADKGTAVLINRAFEDGALFRRVRGKPLPTWAAEFDCHSWAQFFLKYVLAHPAVTCVIPATGKPKHLVDNMGAGIGRLPNAKTRRRMAAVADGL